MHKNHIPLDLKVNRRYLTEPTFLRKLELKHFFAKANFLQSVSYTLGKTLIWKNVKQMKVLK